jgi:hypothetical protein
MEYKRLGFWSTNEVKDAESKLLKRFEKQTDSDPECDFTCIERRRDEDSYQWDWVFDVAGQPSRLFRWNDKAKDYVEITGETFKSAKEIKQERDRQLVAEEVGADGVLREGELTERARNTAELLRRRATK